ncbi:MAG: hypothetical protein A2X45_21385 [Lentisphaerae bacterium GWF2_50_93]|nr:MAG: hypothetical protein A2X45_21385 [Lentisphaerae bacterium GWF2_50_93]
MTGLYSLNPDPHPAIYDFHFFKEGGNPEQLLRFEDNLEILFDAPGILYAHSLGALLSLRAAGGLPNVKALVVYSGFAKFARSADDNIHGQSLDAIAAMKKHLSDNPRGLLNNFHRTMFHPQKSSSSLPDHFNISALAAGLDILSGLDARPMLAKIQIPVLVLHGKDDRIVNPKLAAELAAGLKNSRLHMIENAGHALPLTHVKEINNLVERFISDYDIS